MTPAPPLRLGLVGAGRWGRNYISTIEEMEAAELAVVATSRDDWRAVMDSSLVDGVIIATPPALHAEMTTAAITAGLPILVEKPLTLDLDEASELVALAKSRPSIVLVDHIYLFHLAYRELRRRARSKAQIDSITAVGGNRGPFRSDASPLWDYGTHYVAMCLDLLGEEPDSASLRVLEREHTTDGLGELAEITLGFPGGTEAELVVGNLMNAKERRFEVSGQGWSLVFDDLSTRPLIEIDQAGLEKPIEVLPVPPLSQAVKDFVAAIRLGEPSTESLELAARTVAALDGLTAGPT